MSTEGTPKLGITAERAIEIGDLNGVLVESSENWIDYLLALEKHKGVTEREKLVMMMVTSLMIAQSSVIKKSHLPKSMIFRGNS